MTDRIKYTPFEYICPYLYVEIITPERLYFNVSSSYFIFNHTGKSSCRMSMMSVCAGQSTMAVNPSVAFCCARLRSVVLVANMVVRSRWVILTCYFEEHCCIGGSIISRLYNAAFAVLIYSLMVLTDYHNILHYVTTSSICSTWV